MNHFVCPAPSFSEISERNWMKKSARVSEELISPGIPGLQEATCLTLKATKCMYIVQSEGTRAEIKQALPDHKTILLSL